MVTKTGTPSIQFVLRVVPKMKNHFTSNAHLRGLGCSPTGLAALFPCPVPTDVPRDPPRRDPFAPIREGSPAGPRGQRGGWHFIWCVLRHLLCTRSQRHESARPGRRSLNASSAGRRSASSREISCEACRDAACKVVVCPEPGFPEASYGKMFVVRTRRLFTGARLMTHPEG